MNALNVYPVPDGDTGTNMLNTIRSAVAYARKADPTVAAVAAAAAQGALMGARGNSGVILSQMLRGLKDALAEKEEVSASDLTSAFATARDHAYKAVTQPAPGTMLSALSEMTDPLSGIDGKPSDVLVQATRTGVDAVAHTREQNPMNRAAGVVDAGAYGLWRLLEGALQLADRAAAATLPPSDLLRHASEEIRSRSSGVTTSDAWSREAATSPRPHAGGAGEFGGIEGHGREAGYNVADWKGAYDVQYLVVSPSRSLDELRAEMMEFGADCVLVVGDESAVKVHVHTLHPDKIIAIGMTAGRISDVVIEDLEAMAAEHERATGISVAPHDDATGASSAERAAVGVVAVVPGEGLAEVARSLGASSLHGGATMNPSTEELLEAIRSANAEHVIVLPNDRNVIAAAQQAAGLADVEVTVVPTRTVPQGMSALVKFEPTRSGAENIQAIQRAADEIHGIEVTRAVRESTVDGQRVGEGETMALIDGKLVAHGADEAAVVADAARRVAEAALFTVYVGSAVDPDRVRRVDAALRAARPDAEVDVHDGGQPHYPFLIAIE